MNEPARAKKSLGVIWIDPFVVYVLVHAYSDRSAFHVCGITKERIVAETWFNANSDNDVFECKDGASPRDPMKDPIVGWRTRMDEIRSKGAKQ